jgi:leucyl aminopeptidase (aminopeptidase T)
MQWKQVRLALGSRLHSDAFLCGGEIWFDDVLIRKDGLFVPEELKPLNPDALLAGQET